MSAIQVAQFQKAFTEFIKYLSNSFPALAKDPEVAKALGTTQLGLAMNPKLVYEGFRAAVLPYQSGIDASDERSIAGIGTALAFPFPLMKLWTYKDNNASSKAAIFTHLQSLCKLVA